MARRHMIAILRGVTPDEVADISAELVSAGISMIEVPLNSPEPLLSVQSLAQRFSDQAIIGAGTVLSVDDVEQVHKAGGTLIVSPNCNIDVIKRTKQLGMASWPGVMTPTECFQALDAGADGLKFFPSELIGPTGLKAMKAVLPKDVPTYAVGGVTPENLAEWAKAGANGFGIGGGIYKAGMGANGVRDRADKFVTAYDQVFK